MPKLKRSHVAPVAVIKPLLDPTIDRAPIVWGYARVSREDQELGLQTDALSRAGVLPVHIVTDKMSGTRDDRPGFQSLLASLRAGDTLTVWKLDRLGRKALAIMSLIERLDHQGVRIVVLTLGIDTQTPTGKLMVNVMSSFAQFERDQLIERTQAGLQAAKERGSILGRKAALNAVQQRQAVLMHMREGKSVRDIASIFNVPKSAIGRVVRGANVAAELEGV